MLSKGDASKLREPTSFGKPSQAMMDSIEGRYKLDKKRSCMVGDRLNTDIQFGIQGGLGGTWLAGAAGEASYAYECAFTTLTLARRDGQFCAFCRKTCIHLYVKVGKITC